MKTIAARTVNELFIEHLFINVVTFHGGINAIGYPWGNYVHLINTKKSQKAPDEIAARELANVLKLYSSSSLKNRSIPDYTVGDMIDMVNCLKKFFKFRVMLLMVGWKTGRTLLAGKIV